MSRTIEERHPAVERITADGQWMAATALQTGGDERFEENVDMSLARDKDGRFYVPGSSIAGVLRSHLSRLLASSLDQFGQGREQAIVQALFGRDLGEGKADEVYASLLQFHEAPLDNVDAAVRDGVALDPASGIAKHQAKYNFEVLPVGAAFRLRLELTLYDELPYRLSREEVVDKFGWLLLSLERGDIALGAKTRRGLGRGSVAKWTVRRFDLQNSRMHLVDWLQGRGWSGGEEIAIDKLLASQPKEPPERLTITAHLRLRSSILIRSGSGESSAPDFVHFNENGRYWMTGTSFAGALRQRVRRIAATLWGLEEAEKLTREMFGYVERNDTFASRVKVREVQLEKGGVSVQSRVSIDRFTGGARETALFDEAPWWAAPDSDVQVEITMDAPLGEGRHWTALLIQAFKDVWLADLPVGGEAGVGRGIFEGRRAVFHYPGLNAFEWVRAGDNPAEIELRGLTPEWQRIAEAGLHG